MFLNSSWSWLFKVKVPRSDDLRLKCHYLLEKIVLQLYGNIIANPYDIFFF